jgi:F-type H+-transporting ATPase subunit delta
MKPDRKADNVAAALLETAKRLDCVAETDDSLQILVKLMRELSVFRVFYYSTRLSPAGKARIIENVLSNHCNSVVLELIKELNARNENALIYNVASAFAKMRKALLKEVTVKAVSVSEFSESLITSLTEIIQSRTEGKMILETAVDPNLIAGLKLRIGNRIYDGSIANKIKLLKNELIQT